MIGINRNDIRAILKAGAKAKGMSTSEFKAEIQATIDNIINSSDIEEQKRFKQYFGNRIPTPEEYIFPRICRKNVVKSRNLRAKASEKSGEAARYAMHSSGKNSLAVGLSPYTFP